MRYLRQDFATIITNCTNWIKEVSLFIRPIFFIFINHIIISYKPRQCFSPKILPNQQVRKKLLNHIKWKETARQGRKKVNVTSSIASLFLGFSSRNVTRNCSTHNFFVTMNLNIDSRGRAHLTTHRLLPSQLYRPNFLSKFPKLSLLSDGISILTSLNYPF